MKALKAARKTDGQTYNRAKSDQDSVRYQQKTEQDFVGSGYHPPERFVPLLAKFSQPMNATQRIQLFAQLQRHYGNRYVQRVVSAYKSQNVEEDESKLASEIISKKGSGRAFEPEVREFMEPMFGYDFSNVRIHTDSFAARTAEELGAEAFTIGRDVFFGAGRYNPSSAKGKKLIAHELTHVVQQRESYGAFKENFITGKFEDRYELEAETVASNVMHKIGSDKGSHDTFVPNNKNVVKILSMSSKVGFQRVQQGISSSITKIQRVVKGDITKMSIPEDWARKLNDDELSEQINIVWNQLLTLKPTDPEYQAVRQNLRILEEEENVRRMRPGYTYSRSATASYARKHALSPNHAYITYSNDCTNFVSQALYAGGWSMIFGKDICSERKNDNVWWFKRNECKRRLLPNIHASHTWGAAENFRRFIAFSGRGSLTSNVMSLEIGDVLQMNFSGGETAGHTMIVTKKSSTNIYLSYHTINKLDEPFYDEGKKSGISTRYPKARYFPWRL
jgi:hypothetical protein